MAEHRLRVAATRYLPTDGEGIPLGDPAPVEETPLDFRSGRAMGAAIDASALAHRFGYDQNLCLDPAPSSAASSALREVADLRANGLTLHLWTDQPGLQIYSGNFINDEIGKYGQRHSRRCALCLEPQAWPDSPNHPDYPFKLTTPDAPYLNRIEWRFAR
jgi:aldose 1-epimerase